MAHCLSERGAHLLAEVIRLSGRTRLATIYVLKVKQPLTIDVLCRLGEGACAGRGVTAGGRHRAYLRVGRRSLLVT